MTVLGIVGLIVTELLQRSSLAWSKFGLHFFFGSEWDPVSGAFGALPFVYGTLVSSLIALVIAVPLAVAVAVFVTRRAIRRRERRLRHRDVPQAAAQAHFLRDRTAGGNSQRHLWIVGDLHPGPPDARLR